jgi:hypothetical protein
MVEPTRSNIYVEWRNAGPTNERPNVLRRSSDGYSLTVMRHQEVATARHGPVAHCAAILRGMHTLIPTVAIVREDGINERVSTIARFAGRSPERSRAGRRWTRRCVVDVRTASRAGVRRATTGRGHPEGLHPWRRRTNPYSRWNTACSPRRILSGPRPYADLSRKSATTAANDSGHSSWGM